MAATNLPIYEGGIEKSHRKVIFASSLGTVFEWYDFYLYGSLAAIISKQFFSGVNETTGFIFALLAFAAGFAVRPFGALVFGRLGDLVGRKHTFLITIVIMGLSTALVGVLPGYAQIGGQRAHHPGVIANVAGPGVGWRVRRGGDLRRRACAAQQARVVHELDSNHSDTRVVSQPAGHSVVPLTHGCGFRHLGLAHSFPGVDPVARHIGVHPDAARRIPGVPRHEGGGGDRQGAFDRVVRALGKSAVGDTGAVGGDCRAGRGVVLRPVLFAVLFDPGAEDRCPAG